MRKKLTPKKSAELSHKLVVLADLMIDTIDELGLEKEHEFYINLSKIKENSEKLLDISFERTGLSNSNYLGNLVNKVDTVIRKNYVKQFKK